VMTTKSDFIQMLKIHIENHVYFNTKNITKYSNLILNYKFNECIDTNDLSLKNIVILLEKISELPLIIHPLLALYLMLYYKPDPEYLKKTLYDEKYDYNENCIIFYNLRLRDIIQHYILVIDINYYSNEKTLKKYIDEDKKEYGEITKKLYDQVLEFQKETLTKKKKI